MLETAAAFMVHPSTCNWQDEIVRDWAEKNPGKVDRGHDSTEVEHHHRHARRKLDGFDDIYDEIKEYFSNK